MPITQQSFFGASIRNFSCSIGWGSQSSSLSINLVEDPARDEVFTPNQPGQPGYFVYDNFTFGGIVQSYKRRNSTSGYPVWEVSLTDPRDILEGVQIIIDGYNGTIGTMPNLFNVYGYLENIAFGNAEVNDGGIKTTKLRQGLDALLNIGVGSPINYLGSDYFIDMTSLPALPDYHRIGGGVSLSLMEIINHITEDSGSDYFITLYRGPSGENVIKVHTISRLTQPTFGKINEFINANTSGEAVQNEVGLELRNEVVGKFIVGGNICAIYFNTDQEGVANDFRDDTILQFWGVDANGAPIIQLPHEADNPKFTLDSRFVNVVGVGATYPTDVEEMRAALGGQVSWEVFINSKDVAGSPHQGKANALGIPQQADLRRILQGIPGVAIGGNAVLAFQGFFNQIDLAQLAAFTRRQINRFDRGDIHQENITTLFEYVSSFAQEYYGKKFMVRIDDIQATLESETNRVITNIEPTDGGFIPEAQFPAAIGNKLMPTDFDRVSLEDGRLQAYVRFDNADQLDLSEISPDDLVYDANSVFIKCQVDPVIYVLDIVALTSPRVIITLPGRVFRFEQKNDFAGVLKEILGPPLLAAGVNRGADLNNVFKTLLTRWGADKLMLGNAGLALKPALAAIPLKSNVNTYGPWYDYGASGKVEFEQNEDLVPWNYGGFEILNNVGNALVSAAIAGQIQGETGSITVPDGPNYNIGSELIAGGPFITSVNVEVGENGVTSTYRMETWTPRFGKLAKLNAERMAKLGRENAARRRQLRQIAKIPNANNPFFAARGATRIVNGNALDAPNRNAVNTSSLYIGGQIHQKTDQDVRFNEVAIMPEYNSYSPLSNGYSDKAFMSLDGLFRPFSTKRTDEDVPHYEEPDEDAEKTLNDLDPFQDGNDISIVARDTALEEDTHLSEMTSPNQRPLGLRGPPIIVGWGYDTNGKPVPNSTPDEPGEEFLAEHLERSDKWKVGPLDIRWDQSRKVWAAGNGANVRVIRLADDLNYGGVTSGILQDLSWGGPGSEVLSFIDNSGEPVYVGEAPGYNSISAIAVTSGRNVLAIQSNENQALYLVISAFLE